MIEDALRESLSRRSTPAPRRKVQLPTFRGNGVYPGVDLDDSRGLLDLMKDDHDSRKRP